MRDGPLVSIVIPFYDQDEFLLDAVRSADEQTYVNLEIIVVDDHSPRASARELLEWRGIERLKIIRHGVNVDCAATRNTGVLASTGEFVLPLDADDQLSPDYLEATVPLFRDDPGLGGVSPAVQFFGEKQWVWQSPCELPAYLTYPGPSSFIYRRAMYDSVGGYKAHWRFAEDFDFVLTALEKGWKIRSIDKPLRRKRSHPAGKSRRGRTDVTRSLLRDHRELCERYLEDVIADHARRRFSAVRKCADVRLLMDDLEERLRAYRRLQDGQADEAIPQGATDGR